MWRSRLFGTLAVAIVATTLSGCGAAQQTRTKNDFKTLALAMHNHADAHKKGPGSWDELVAFAESNDPASAAAFKKMQTDGVVFFCDVKFVDATGGPSNAIFAYEAKAPQSGGIIAMLDGSVREVTAEAFQALLKEQTEKSPATVAKKSS